MVVRPVGFLQYTLTGLPDIICMSTIVPPPRSREKCKNEDLRSQDKPLNMISSEHGLHL